MGSFEEVLRLREIGPHMMGLAELHDMRTAGMLTQALQAEHYMGDEVYCECVRGSLNSRLFPERLKHRAI